MLPGFCAAGRDRKAAHLLWRLELHDAPPLGAAGVVLHHIGVHHDTHLPELVLQVLCDKKKGIL